MFYHIELLSLRKNGKYSRIWLAATCPTQFRRYVNRLELDKICVPDLCQDIIEQMNRAHQLSLLLAARLSFGTVRVYQMQVQLLYDDCRNLCAASKRTAVSLINLPIQKRSKIDRKVVRHNLDLNQSFAPSSPITHYHTDYFTNIEVVTGDEILQVLEQFPPGVQAANESITLRDIIEIPEVDGGDRDHPGFGSLEDADVIGFTKHQFAEPPILMDTTDGEFENISSHDPESVLVARDGNVNNKTMELLFGNYDRIEVSDVNDLRGLSRTELEPILIPEPEQSDIQLPSINLDEDDVEPKRKRSRGKNCKLIVDECVTIPEENMLRQMEVFDEFHSTINFSFIKPNVTDFNDMLLNENKVYMIYRTASTKMISNKIYQLYDRKKKVIPSISTDICSDILAQFEKVGVSLNVSDLNRSKRVTVNKPKRVEIAGNLRDIPVTPQMDVTVINLPPIELEVNSGDQLNSYRLDQLIDALFEKNQPIVQNVDVTSPVNEGIREIRQEWGKPNILKKITKCWMENKHPVNLKVLLAGGQRIRMEGAIAFASLLSLFVGKYIVLETEENSNEISHISVGEKMTDILNELQTTT